VNRYEKIKLLQSIREGKISKRVLLPTKTYVFTEHKGDVIQYKMEGKLYSQTEYEFFCKEIENENRVLKSLNTGNEGNLVITLVFKKGKTIL
jgi:hypothetical protein